MAIPVSLLTQGLLAFMEEATLALLAIQVVSLLRRREAGEKDRFAFLDDDTAQARIAARSPGTGVVELVSGLAARRRPQILLEDWRVPSRALRFREGQRGDESPSKDEQQREYEFRHLRSAPRELRDAQFCRRHN